MHTFLIDKLLGDTAILTPEDARHALQVLRLRDGELVGAVDGCGLYIEGPLERVGKDTATVQITKRALGWGEPPVETTLCIALLKQRERLEWLVEKAVELGVMRIVPLLTQRTERGAFNAERFQRLMVAAMKQCQRSRLPELTAPQTPTQALQNLPGLLHILAWCEAEQPLQTLAQAAIGRHAAYWIGPEGDFTAEEAAALTTAGAHAVSLGHTRLRTETAALYALSWGKAVQGF
jgi:16S rRNA (uracil1498-N3)-methyltransferase